MAVLQTRIIKAEPSSSFDCGVDSINSMVKDAYQSTLLQFAMAYEVLVNETLVGYYMLTFKKIIVSHMPDEFTDYESLLETCVSVHIRFIAIEKKYQKKTIGTIVLYTIEDEVQKLIKKWPIRLITLDATKNNVNWYKKHGYTEFEYSPENADGITVQMYKDFWTEENRRLEDKYLDDLM